MIMTRMDFCTECREETEYELKRISYNKWIKEKEYEFEITAAFCKKCGGEVNIPGLMDNSAREIDEQYRKSENIISVRDIRRLLELYNIGKAPLSLALGFGEITVTRYLQGQIPSREYSDIMKKSLESPSCMIEYLEKNRKKIGNTAYKKAMKSAEELAGLFVVSDKMLITISYIFEKIQEVTPLALQKILYYIQGIYMVVYGKPLYEEDCQAWVHGPVYESVYEMFKTFKYNPIEDTRFAMFKNRFQELSESERRVIDLVTDTFGMYSGKTLEKITHKENPWKKAREGYLPDESSNVVISKDNIREYFQDVSQKYDISTMDGIKKYINQSLAVA